MTSAPNRRWHRFSLRALFVLLALVALLLAYPLSWIRQRHDALAWVAAQAEYWSDMPVSQRVHLGADAPWPLRLFGEEGAQQISVVVEKDAVATKQQELERLFPEAAVLVMTPGPGYTGKHARK